METNKQLENTIAKGIVKGSLILTLISIVSTMVLALIFAAKTDTTTTK
jgi:uncharacterized oligopeptide transporter (OPT) family protein